MSWRVDIDIVDSVDKYLDIYLGYVWVVGQVHVRSIVQVKVLLRRIVRQVGLQWKH